MIENGKIQMCQQTEFIFVTMFLVFRISSFIPQYQYASKHRLDSLLVDC